ncbi:MAG: hypothetical protein IPK17_20600 [Chloroflexi bacterium]|nr:hypothetical protein [Chloroflexota bacterium]
MLLDEGLGGQRQLDQVHVEATESLSMCQASSVCWMLPDASQLKPR